MRLFYTYICVFLTTGVFCQTTTLFQNINFRAKELKHSLNTTGDSLILEGERTIYKVQIFNSDFDQTIAVEDSKVKIPLNEIPVGRYVVEATLKNKLIVLTLLRNESLSPENDIASSEKKTSLFGDSTPITVEHSTLNKTKPVAPRLVVVQKTDTPSKKDTIIADVEKSEPNSENETESEESLTTTETLITNPGHKKVQSYWVIYKTNNAYGAGTVKRFADQELVNQMIENIHLDKRTIAGKHNELTIWEVYDVSKFVKYKIKKTNSLNDRADCFNSTPYFKVDKDSTEL